MSKFETKNERVWSARPGEATFVDKNSKTNCQIWYFGRELWKISINFVKHLSTVELFRFKHYNTLLWIRGWGAPTAHWGSREGRITPPKPAKIFFWPQTENNSIMWITSWNPIWPQYGIVFREILTDHNMELFWENNSILWITLNEIFDFQDFKKFGFWRFWSLSEFIKNMIYQKSLRPISQRCQLRHFPEISTQNSSRCSIHGRTDGRTDATPSENRCSHCFISCVKQFW